MFDYVQLPNKLFYTTEEKDKSIIKIIKNDNTLLTLGYLYINTNRKDITVFTIEDLILSCGYKEVDRHKGKNLDQFKYILNQLKELKIITYDFDFNNIKPTQLIKCKLNLIKEHEGFIQLYDWEKEKILTSKIKEIDNKKLLMYYCYLKSRIYKRAKSDGDLIAMGGRAEITWVGYRTITDDLDIEDRTIKKYNDALVKLNLIRIGNAGLWHYKNDSNKVVRESNNIYTLYTKEEDIWKLNIKEGIKFYKQQEKENGKVFINNQEYKNNNRKLNGELGSIIKKENNGTATEKDLNRKDEIIDLINGTSNNTYKLQVLMQENEGTILSDIYYSLGKDKLYYKYYELEFKLGLINKDGDLMIDYDYYKWIMINYNRDKHDYYLNCVKKHKKR